MTGKSSINLTSLVEFEHHSMADIIRNENEEKKIKVKAPVTAKKNKQHQTSNCDISVTSAAADLYCGIFTVCRSSPDLPPVKISLVTEILILRHIA